MCFQTPHDLSGFYPRPLWPPAFGLPALLIPILCPVYIYLLFWLSLPRRLPLFLSSLYYSLGIDTRLADEFVALELFLPKNIKEHPLSVCWTWGNIGLWTLLHLWMWAVKEGIISEARFPTHILPPPTQISFKGFNGLHCLSLYLPVSTWISILKCLVLSIWDNFSLR